MHPSILLDLLRTGHLTKEQLSIAEIEAVQQLMIQRAIEGYIAPIIKDEEKPKLTKTTERPKYGKLIGSWGGHLNRKSRKVA